MTYSKVTKRLLNPTLSVIKIEDVRFYRGNVKNDEATDPRIQMKVCIQGINEEGFFEYDGIPKDAWFLCILRKSQQDEDGRKLQVKVGSVLKCLGLDTPESKGLIKGMGQAAEIMLDGMDKGPLIMAGLVTTTLARPIPDENGNFSMSPRYANVVYFNQEASAWVRSL